MGTLVAIIGAVLRCVFVSCTRLAAENLALRQQLIVLQRRSKPRPDIRKSDRILLVWLYRLCPRMLDAVTIIRPDTIIRWHRMGFRALWRWKSRPRGGRTKVSREIRNLIREMSLANPLWGAPRIHGELLQLGIKVAQSTVARYMVKRCGAPSQSWKTFLDNHAGGIAACDFLVVPAINLKMLYAFVVLSHDRREIQHIAVTDHPTAKWPAQQLVEAFAWSSAPNHLIRDNDSIYGAAFRTKLAALGIRDGPTAFRSPWQNAYVERVIGSIRRECLDHMIVWNVAHLRRVLKAYVKYYNEARTHLSLAKDAPVSRSIQRSGAIISTLRLGGLHHEYGRIE